MESELWNELYKVVLDLGRLYRTKRTQYSDAWIVLTFLWAVLHDRPRRWACKAQNWPAQLGQDIPSEATLSRRLRSAGVLALMEALANRYRQEHKDNSWLRWMDSLPLTVGGSSHDHDAGYGWAGGVMAKGYKLHVLVDPRCGVDAWQLEPMNINDKTAAVGLLYQSHGGGYVVAGNQYDSNHLFDIAGDLGSQLLAPWREDTGPGHQYQSPFRLRCRALLSGPFGQSLLATRVQMEGFLGRLGNFGGGLSPLPHWVRRERRVRLWVQAKLILDAVRQHVKARLAA